MLDMLDAHRHMPGLNPWSHNHGRETGRSAADSAMARVAARQPTIDSVTCATSASQFPTQVMLWCVIGFEMTAEPWAVIGIAQHCRGLIMLGGLVAGSTNLAMRGVFKPVNGG